MTTERGLVNTSTRDAQAAGEPSWREVFRVSNPGRTVAVVALVAASTFAYAALLIVVFDGRSWWGASLPGMAAAYGAVFLAVFALARPSRGRRAGLAAFLLTGWAGITMVTWLPRQRPSDWSELAQLGWWAAWTVAIYVAVPVGYAVATRTDPRSYGLRLGLFRGEARIFAVLLPVIVIGAYLAAGQPRFQEVYPFYGEWPDGPGSPAGLAAWWVMYSLTFVALEFFFRGFLVTAGFGQLGWWAIPAMAAPYCLLHLDKPVPEMVTSLFGGLLLGVVALRTRSILAGVLAHVTLAVGTDAAVLLRR